MNWQRVRERAPTAVEAFVEWARTKSLLLNWGRDLKAAPSPETAFALLIGPLTIFFREQDIVFSYHVTKLGRTIVLTHRPDKHGHYKVTSRTMARVDPTVCWAYSFSRAFEYLQARIDGHEVIPEATETILQE